MYLKIILSSLKSESNPDLNVCKHNKIKNDMYFLGKTRKKFLFEST